MKTDKSTLFRQRILVLACAMLCATIVVPATAEETTGWRLRLLAVHLSPDVSLSGIDNQGRAVSVDADNASGVGLQAEYRFSRRLGFEVGILRAASELEVRIASPGNGVAALAASPRMIPVTAGLLVHLIPNSRFDLYVAGRLAYVLYGDVTLEAPGLGRQQLTGDDDFGWSLALGADIVLGEKGWGLNVEVARLDTRLTLSSDLLGLETDLGLDPIVVGAGLVYRF